MPLGAPQRVNFPTVQWTVGKEVSPHGVGKCREATKGTARSAPCKRGRSLINFLSIYKKIERNFPLSKRKISLYPFINLFECIFYVSILETEIPESPRKKKTGNFRGRSLLQSVPSPKTVHRTVFGFTPCRAPKGWVDLRLTWDSVPNPARGAASGLCQRDNVPLETQCLSASPIWGAAPNPAKGTPPFGIPFIPVRFSPLSI